MYLIVFVEYIDNVLHTLQYLPTYLLPLPIPWYLVPIRVIHCVVQYEVYKTMVFLLLFCLVLAKDHQLQKKLLVTLSDHEIIQQL